MHVLLVQPPNHNQVWAGVSDKYMTRGFHSFPPLQIMSLSAYLKAHTNHRVTMLDCQREGLDFEEIRRRIAAINPDIVGTTSNTHLIYDVFQVAQAAKKVDAELPVIIGGSHVFSYPREALALPGVDYAVRGDGELTLAALLDALEGKGELSAIPGLLYRDRRGEVVENPPRSNFRELDELPFPDRQGLATLEGYYTAGMEDALCTTMVTSRGCPYDCPFCSTYRTYRRRSAGSIVDEMEHCVDLGISEVYFVDDTFNLPGKRLVELSEEMLRRRVNLKWATKMTCSHIDFSNLQVAKESGCSRIHFGVETGTPEGQVAIGKSTSDLEQVRRVFRWCKELGIKTAAYMMLGLPTEKNEADVLRSADFVESIDPTYVIWALYSPYPDSQLWKDGAELGMWKGDEWLEHMVDPRPGAPIPVAWTQHMTQDEQIRILNKLMFRFYTSPTRVTRYLLGIRSPAELRRVVRSGISVLRSSMP